MSSSNTYDVCIIGGGPAGHSAALYTSRGMLKTVLFEGIMNPGGQLTQTTEVENYLGFPEGIQGYELCMRFKEQSEKWGTEVLSENVEKITESEIEKCFNVYYDEMNKCIITKSVIICSGSTARLLEFEGSSQFWNKGITACAVCHGALPMFRNKPLFVVGGGDTAMEDALYLSKYTQEVYIVHRRDSFRASKIMQQRVFSNPNIKILWDTEIVKASGTDLLESIRLRNNKSGEEKEYNASGLFYAIGHTPCSDFLRGSDLYIALDSEGYIITEEDSTKTTVDGIFCAGDIREKDKKFKQAIVAAGTGCKAALEAIDYLQQQ